MATKGGSPPTQVVNNSMDTNKNDSPLVAAIDIGTTFSGYAFQFKHEYQANPCNISSGVFGTARSVSVKEPTIVLFDEHKKFHSFGYKAEDTYAELFMDDEHHKWYFFKRFKMRLYDKKVNRNVEIEDDKGRKMLASEVFGAVIKYFKDQLLDRLKRQGTEVENKDIHWVLTVPAIWTDSAKQFMRESANKAGINGDQLSIVLESDAAILMCQMIPTDKFIELKSAKSDIDSPGTKIMVIDLGDEMAEFTVHGRQDDGGLRELHSASVHALGDSRLNHEFFSMIIKFVGGPIFKTFIDENKADHLDMQGELEVKKHCITPKTSGKITIKIPVTLLKTYESESGKDVMEAIDCSPYAGKITWKWDKMRIDAQVFKNFFKPCTDKIVEHIKDLLKSPQVQGTNIFLMVGGLSESEMIQDAIMTALPRGKVIIPAESGLTVLKGAVIFGHRPIAITSRKSKYTYGFNISPPFDPTIHPEDHRVSVGGVDRCRDVFKKYILEGETVRFGDAKSGTHITHSSNQREMILKVYACPRPDPVFVDDEDVRYLGKVVVNIPESAARVRVEVKMMFGETELNVEAIEMSQRTKISAFFDFQ
ncbi:Heat shock 70 kDa protein 12A [Mactra antiquata]